jgi:hypothetical protein
MTAFRAAGFAVVAGLLVSACGSAIVHDAALAKAQVTTSTNALCRNAMLNQSTETCPEYVQRCRYPMWSA